MVSNSPIDQVKESAKFVSENSQYVHINRDKIKEFLSHLNKEDYEAKSSAVQFPLNFSNPQQEVNFWFILDLLNFGSGYRKELHKYSNRGAYETICYGLFGMYLSQSGNLNADFLRKLSLNEIGSYFSIENQVEYEIQPGIYSYKDSELKPLAVSIQKVLKESAEAVADLGFKDFSEFVWKITDPSKNTQPPLASVLIEKILEQIPAFRDKVTYKGRTVYTYKKIQLFAADLYRRFKDSIPERFGFSDVNELTVFSDNVLPAVLRYYGILEISDKDLQEDIDSKSTELESGSPQETELRLQAIQACQEMIEISKSEKIATFINSAMELDYYLWTKGKDESIRKFERHVSKKTVFY